MIMYSPIDVYKRHCFVFFRFVFFAYSQVICEETTEATGLEIDLQCREHVASDTESEAETQSDPPNNNQCLPVFPQQPYGSPSSIGPNNSEVTHRPKAIKAKYCQFFFFFC